MLLNDTGNNFIVYETCFKLNPARATGPFSFFSVICREEEKKYYYYDSGADNFKEVTSNIVGKEIFNIGVYETDFKSTVLDLMWEDEKFHKKYVLEHMKKKLYDSWQ